MDKWVEYEKGLEKDAVIGGVLENGEKLFIGRANYNGVLIPGRISLEKDHPICITSYAAEEIKKDSFEILINSEGFEYFWVKSGYGRVPAYAVVGGETEDGEQLYVGRVQCKTHLTPGMIHPGNRCCFYTKNGFEANKQKYEVLVKTVWLPPSQANALIAGRYNGKTVNVGRTLFDENLFPCCVIAEQAHFTKDSKTKLVKDYEILCGDLYEWKAASDDNVLRRALSCGKLKDGRSIYVARVTTKNGVVVGKALLEEVLDLDTKELLLNQQLNGYFPCGSGEEQRSNFKILVKKEIDAGANQSRSTFRENVEKSARKVVASLNLCNCFSSN